MDLQLWVLNKLIIYISWTSINTVYQCNFVTYVHEILKGVGAGQAVVVGDEDVVQLDVAVLDDPQRHLVLDLADLQARAPTVDNEPANNVWSSQQKHLRCIYSCLADALYVTSSACVEKTST